MKRYLKIVLLALLTVWMAWLALSSTRDFNNAATTIEFVRSFFWMIIGIIATATAFNWLKRAVKK